MIGRFVDNLVGVFNPRAQLSRMAARELIQSKHQYTTTKPKINK